MGNKVIRDNRAILSNRTIRDKRANRSGCEGSRPEDEGCDRRAESARDVREEPEGLRGRDVSG